MGFHRYRNTRAFRFNQQGFLGTFRVRKPFRSKPGNGLNGLGNGLIPPEAKPPLTEATTAAECKLSGLEALLAEGSSPMTIAVFVFVLVDVFMVFCRKSCV
jgi:hypothetical protein